MHWHSITTAERWALALGLVLFVLLRWPFVVLPSLDIDEATSVWLANRPLHSVIPAAMHRDTHPPLFYVLLHPLAMVTNLDWMLRCLPLGISLLLLWRVVGFAWRLGGATAGLLTFWIALSSAASVQIGGDLRMYGLAALATFVAFECAVAYWTARDTVDDPVVLPDTSRRRWSRPLVGYAIAGSAALYTAIPTAPLLVAIGLLAPWLDVGPARPKLGPWIAIQAGIALAFVPWIPIALHQSHQWMANLPAAISIDPLDPMLKLERALGMLGQLILAHGVSVPPIRFLGGVALLIVVGWALFRATDPRTLEGRLVRVGLLAIPLLGFVLELAMLIPTPLTVTPRYLYGLLPFVWCGLGLWGGSADRVRLGVILLLTGTNGWGMYALSQTPWDDFRGAARILASLAEPNAPVFVMAPYIVLPLDHYWPSGGARMLPLESYSDRAEERAEVEALVRAAADAEGLPSEIWVVLSHDAARRGQPHDRGGALLLKAIRESYPETESFLLDGVILVRCTRGP